MHNIYDCVDAFSRLLHTEYKIVIGRKGITKTLLVHFHQLIEERVDMLPLLETLFDSNETVF